MKSPSFPLLVATAIAATTCTFADVLELKDGRVLNGLYEGGTAGTLRFAVAGNLEVFPVTDVIALTIAREGGNPPASAPTAAATTPAAAPMTTTAPSSSTATIPAGETLIVRLRSTVSTRQSRSGEKFDSILESDLRAGDTVIAPRGSLVRGTVVEVMPPHRLRKIAAISLTLDSVQTPGGDIALHTEPYAVRTNHQGGVIRGAARGAAIGAITDEEIDNAAGAGAAMAAMRRGDQIEFDSGSLITFTLATAISAP